MTHPAFPGVDTTMPPRTMEAISRRLSLMAAAVNRLNQGKMNIAQNVTLTESVAATVVTDSRLTPFSAVFFDPITANAAAEQAAGTMYTLAANRRKGQWTITHANNAQTDRTFNMVILA